MSLYQLLKILFFIFILLAIFFIGLGIYALDTTLILIAVLFATVAVLIGLETKQILANPFRKK